jgi:hypothetical protein
MSVYVGVNIRDQLGPNVGLYSSYNSRPDAYRYGMINGLMNQNCNVGYGTPQFSSVGGGATWNYNGRNPYIAQQVYAEKSWERTNEALAERERGRIMAETGVMPGPYWASGGRPLTTTNVYTGQTYANSGFYGNDRAFGNGLQISGAFNSRANFLDFNMNNNCFGRPSYFGGPSTAFDVGLHAGGLNLNVGGLINNLFRR